MRGKPDINIKPGFIELKRRIEYAAPYRDQQKRSALVKGIVCHGGEIVVLNEEVVTV